MPPTRGRLAVSSNVAQTIGAPNLGLPRLPEVAICECRSPFYFTLGLYGQTIERCGNPKCPNNRPHRPGDHLELSVARESAMGRDRQRRRRRS